MQNENDTVTDFLNEEEFNAIVNSTTTPTMTLDEAKSILDFITNLPSENDNNGTIPENPFILSNQIAQQSTSIIPHVSIYAFQERKNVLNHFKAVEWFRPRDTNVKTNIQIIDPSFLYLFQHVPHYHGLIELERLTKNEAETYSDLRQSFSSFLLSNNDASQDVWKVATTHFYQLTQHSWEAVNVLKEKNKKVFSYQVRDPTTNQATTVENNVFPFTQKTVELAFQLICKIIANRQNQNTISRSAKKTPPLLNRLKLTIFSPQNPKQVLYIAYSNLLSPRFSNESEKEKGVEFMSKYMELQILDPTRAEQLLQEVSLAPSAKKRSRKDTDATGSNSSGSNHSTPNNTIQDDDTDLYFSSLSPQPQKIFSGESSHSSPMMSFEAKADLSNIQKKMKFSSDAALQVANFGYAQNVQIYGDKVTFALPSELAHQLYTKENKSLVNLTLTLSAGQDTFSLAGAAPFKSGSTEDAVKKGEEFQRSQNFGGDNVPIGRNRPYAITAGQPSDFRTPPSFEELQAQLQTIPDMPTPKPIEEPKKKTQVSPQAPYQPVPLSNIAAARMAPSAAPKMKRKSPSSAQVPSPSNSLFAPPPPPPPSNAFSASQSVPSSADAQFDDLLFSTSASTVTTQSNNILNSLDTLEVEQVPTQQSLEVRSGSWDDNEDEEKEIEEAVVESVHKERLQQSVMADLQLETLPESKRVENTVKQTQKPSFFTKIANTLGFTTRLKPSSDQSKELVPRSSTKSFSAETNNSMAKKKKDNSSKLEEIQQVARKMEEVKHDVTEEVSTVFDKLTISEPKPIPNTNAFGYNDIQLAILNEDYDTLQSLLSEETSIVNSKLEHQDHFGRTPFHTACLVGDYDAFEMLCLKYSINALNLRDHQNKTCMDLAFDEGYEEFVEIVNSNMEFLFVK